MQIDLDAARAARAEARAARGDNGERSIKLAGETYELPVELPYDFAYFTAAGDHRLAFMAVLGEENFRKFWAVGISVEDLEVLAEQIEKLYGSFKPGESQASDDS